jgi:hypothetical protein
VPSRSSQKTKTSVTRTYQPESGIHLTICSAWNTRDCTMSEKQSAFPNQTVTVMVCKFECGGPSNMVGLLLHTSSSLHACSWCAYFQWPRFCYPGTLFTTTLHHLLLFRLQGKLSFSCELARPQPERWSVGSHFWLYGSLYMGTMTFFLSISSKISSHFPRRQYAVWV